MAAATLSLSLALVGAALLGMERANPTKYLGPIGFACLASALASFLGAGPAFLFALFLASSLAALLFWRAVRPGRGMRFKRPGKAVGPR